MVDDSDMPGASIMTIPANAQATMSSPTMQQGAQQLPPTLGDMPAGSGSPTAQQSSQHQQGPSSTLTQPAMSASSSSVLTPPDESAPHHQGARKRRQGPAEPSAVDLGMSPALSEPAATPAAGAASSPHKRRRTSSRGGASGQIRPPSTPSLQANGGFRSSGAQASGAAASNGAAAAATGLEDGTLSGFLQVPLIEELVDAIRNHAPPRWREQALDIFFRDFSAEELDLQVKISENVLSNENKAMVFCKMPDRVRQHWVGKFRELHLLNKAT